MKNNYYDIAMNDLHYIEDAFHLGYYNPLSAQIMQVAEKALKSVLELVDTGVESLLKSHNLKNIYLRIHAVCDDFVLDVKDLSYLTNFYYDARYPGDGWYEIPREECLECAKIMYDVMDAVNGFRSREYLDTVDITRRIFMDEERDAEIDYSM